jgi:hypothetical protein
MGLMFSVISTLCRFGARCGTRRQLSVTKNIFRSRKCWNKGKASKVNYKYYIYKFVKVIKVLENIFYLKKKLV